MPSTINAIPDPQTGQLRKKGAADASLVLQTNGANAVVINGGQAANFVSTGAIKLPSGTLGQRPASPINGMVRYNTTTLNVEGYANNTWVAFK